MTLTLASDLLTLVSMYAAVLSWIIDLRTSLLIVPAVFLSEYGQRDRQTDRRNWTLLHAGDSTAIVGNYANSHPNVDLQIRD